MFVGNRNITRKSPAPPPGFPTTSIPHTPPRPSHTPKPRRSRTLAAPWRTETRRATPPLRRGSGSRSPTRAVCSGAAGAADGVGSGGFKQKARSKKAGEKSTTQKGHAKKGVWKCLADFSLGVDWRIVSVVPTWGTEVGCTNDACFSNTDSREMVIFLCRIMILGRNTWSKSNTGPVFSPCHAWLGVRLRYRLHLASGSHVKPRLDVHSENKLNHWGVII